MEEKYRDSTQSKENLPHKCGFNSAALSGVERGWAETAMKTEKLEEDKILSEKTNASRRENPGQRLGKRRIDLVPEPLLFRC